MQSDESNSYYLWKVGAQETKILWSVCRQLSFRKLLNYTVLGEIPSCNLPIDFSLFSNTVQTHIYMCLHSSLFQIIFCKLVCSVLFLLQWRMLWSKLVISLYLKSWEAYLQNLFYSSSLWEWEVFATGSKTLKATLSPNWGRKKRRENTLQLVLRHWNTFILVMFSPFFFFLISLNVEARMLSCPQFFFFHSTILFVNCSQFLCKKWKREVKRRAPQYISLCWK